MSVSRALCPYFFSCFSVFLFTNNVPLLIMLGTIVKIVGYCEDREVYHDVFTRDGKNGI